MFETTIADTSLSGGTQYLNITQKLEGQDVKQLAYGTPNAKPVTLSFWVKSSKAGQFASELEISGGVNVQTWSVNTADTWEYKTVTFEGNTSTAITTTTTTGMWVVLCWMAAGDGISGPNFQSGWRALNQTERLPEGIPNMADSTNNIMRFTGVQMEVGKVATPFEHRSYGEELALCQRYYYVVGSEGNTTNYMNGGIEGPTSAAMGGLAFPVEMRSVPTASLLGTNVTKFYSFATGTDDSVSISTNRSSRTVGSLYIAGFSGATGGQTCTLYDGGSGSGISFDAEL